MSRKLPRKPVLIVLGLVVAAAIAGGAWHFLRTPAETSSAPAETAASTPPGQLPDPVILVINRAIVMRASKVGQDITRQVGTFAEAAKNDLVAQDRALQADLRAQKGAPSPALQAKQRALQALAQSKDNQIKAAFEQGRSAMEQQLGPILKQVVDEHHANLLLDKQAVPFATNSEFDITPEVVRRLDAKMPSFKITIPPPAAK